MIEVLKNNFEFILKSSSKEDLVIDTENKDVSVWDFSFSYPWEYEKAGILSEVKEYENKLFYSISLDSKHIVIIFDDSFELKEEILSFFGDVDVLFILWTKASAKIFESIEAKLVIPFSESKDIFLNTLGQHKEAINSYKIKSDLSWDISEFINLED